MRYRVERYILPALLGFAPVLLMAMTWTPDGHATTVTRGIKLFAALLLMAELFVIIVALRRDALLALRMLRPPIPVIAAALGLLANAVGTAVLIAPNQPYALIVTSLWILHALYGLAVFHLCDREFARKSLTTAWMAGWVAYAVGLMVFVASVRIPADVDWIGGLPAFSQIRHPSFYAGAVIGLCVGRFATAHTRTGLAATVLVAVLAFSVPLWTGSRGTFTAVAIALAVGLALFPALRCRRVLLGVPASLLLALVFVSQLPVPSEVWGLERIFSATSSGDVTSVTSGRDGLWRETVGAIMKRPLFGYGEGQLPVVTSRIEWHPHNALLQVMLAWGVVGTACALVLGLYLARRVIVTVRANSGEWLPPCLALMVLVAYSAHDGTLFFPFPLGFAAACAALAAAGSRGKTG